VRARPSAAQRPAERRANWWLARDNAGAPASGSLEETASPAQSITVARKEQALTASKRRGSRACSSARCTITQVCGWHEWGPDARRTNPALTTGDRRAAKGVWHAPTRTARTCAAAQAHSRAAAPRARPPPGWSPGRPRGCPRAPRPRTAAAQPTAAPGGSRMRACSPTPPRAARWPAGSCRSTRQLRTVQPPCPGYGFNLLPFGTLCEHSAGRARYQASLCQGPYHSLDQCNLHSLGLHSAFHQKAWSRAFRQPWMCAAKAPGRPLQHARSPWQRPRCWLGASAGRSCAQPQPHKLQPHACTACSQCMT